MIRELYKVCEALAVRYPGNRDPFHTLARLMEESGELAEHVHIREGSQSKRAKGCTSTDAELAGEVYNVLTAVLDIARHYGIQSALEERIREGYERAVNEGLVDPISD